MKRKIYFVGYIFAWILLVGYLSFSNRLIALSIPDDQLMQKVNIEEFSSTTTPIFSMDVPFVYTGGMYEYGYCVGWAFCETDYDNSNKVITIIFQNVDTNMSYACDNVVQAREDVYSAYKNTKRIYNDMVGVYCRFSTLNLPYGTYEMLIHVTENEYDYGIASTGEYYTKTSTGFVNSDIEGNEFVLSSNGEILAKEVSLSVENFLDHGKWNIDYLTAGEDSITIAGWASFSPATNDRQKVYVAITYTDGSTKFYTTQVVNRNDLGAYFNDESYASCGFKTTIPVEDANELQTLSLITEVDGKYYPIILNGKVFHKQAEDEEKESVGSVDTENENTLSVNVILSQAEETGIAYIDNAEFYETGLIIRGWASYSAETNTEQRVYVGLTNTEGITTYYATTQCKRNDVATLKGESYILCGYSVEIKPAILEDEYTVSIVIQVGEDFYPINIRNSRMIKHLESE